jgi:hypothetical protein
MTDAERDKASEQQKEVRKRLDALLTLDDTYLSGSYRRRTLIRPLDDIDLLVVLNWEAYKDTIALDAAGASAALDLIDAALAKAYPKSERHRFDNCIQIVFAGTGIGFDVVPAFRVSKDEFRIPDEGRGKWLVTNPREVERLVTEANQGRTDEWLVPLVKLLKAWNDEHGKPLRGYHLEAMAYYALLTAPANARDGIAWLLEQLSTRVWSTTPDIWLSGESPDADLTLAQRQTASALLAVAGQAARRAIRADEEGRVSDAHAIWREIFGGRYPESGITKSAKPMSAWEAMKAVSTGAYITASSHGIAHAARGHAGGRSSTSHGGDLDINSSTDADAMPRLRPTHIDHLEWQIARAREQFTALERLDPAAAAADPALWPVRPGDELHLYAVLVGDQRTPLGRTHRILITIPLDAPATEPRVYRLSQHVRHAPRADGRFGPVRGLRHQWPDGAMCTHARRDRWDGRLVTLLVYAADWLFRQDYYQLTGKWLGREIGRHGQLLINGRHATAPHASHRRATRRRAR